MSERVFSSTLIAVIILAVIAIGMSAYSVSTISQLQSGVESKIADLENRIKEITQALAQITTPAPTQTAVPAAPIELTVIGPWAGDEAKYFEEVIKAFEQEHPNIKVKYVVMRAEDQASTLPIQFQAGVTPADVIITSWGWFVVNMAQKGFIVDVTDLINEGDYIPGILDSVKWDGKIWASPFTMFLKPGFWYRKSFFQQYNLAEPKSWDEFVNLLKEIKTRANVKNPVVVGDSVGWPISDLVEHFLNTFLGPDAPYKLINCEIKFTDPQVKEVFEQRILPLIREGYFSAPIEWTTGVEKWWAGEYALYFMGTWITGMVRDPNDLGVFPLPGASAIVGGTDYIYIPKFTKNLDAAKTFLKYLATKGQEVHSSTRAGKLPTWTKADPNKIWAPMRVLYEKIVSLGMRIVPDLDDAVGGRWQTLFWDQLKLLWASPDRLNDVLSVLADEMPACKK